jgi:hypothetical protein
VPGYFARGVWKRMGLGLTAAPADPRTPTQVDVRRSIPNVQPGLRPDSGHVNAAHAAHATWERDPGALNLGEGSGGGGELAERESRRPLPSTVREGRSLPADVRGCCSPSEGRRCDRPT